MEALHDPVIPRWTLIQQCEFCEKSIYLFPEDEQPVESCPRCNKAGNRLTEFVALHGKLNEFLKFPIRCAGYTILHADEKLSALEPEEFRAPETARLREAVRGLGGGADAVLQAHMKHNMPEHLR
ncbi:MAG: hypothetical protein JWO19_4886 [Bryobacterales bacterium]|nr:hypothetical protein [Bryobacterales bacterium]